MKQGSARRTHSRIAETSPRQPRGRGRSAKAQQAGADLASARRPLVLLIAIFIAALLAVVGLQLMRADSATVGAIVTLLALIIFLTASKRLSGLSLSSEDLGDLVRQSLPAALIALAFFFSVLAMYQVVQPKSLSGNRLAILFWAASLLFFIVGILRFDHWRPQPAAYVARARENVQEIALVLAILAVGATARLYQLDQHPYPWSGDEASVGLEGRRILTGENTDLFNTGWSGQPNLSFYPTALTLAVFGNTILAVRIVSAVIGVLTILLLYLLGRELFDRTIGLISAAFLALFPFHLQFSRIGVSNIVDGFVVTLSLWLIFRAVRKDSLSGYVWAGIVSGLALYTYVGSRLVLVLAFVALAYVSIRQPGYFRTHKRHILAFLASSWITMAPMAFFFIKHRDIFMTRLGQAGILLNGWLTKEAATTGRSVASILFNQFTRSTLVYISQNAHGNFFNSPQPYLTFVGSLFFIIGMGYAFQQLLKIPYMLLLTWFWSVVIFGGVLTLDPPANTRLVMTTPAVALLVAIGLSRLLDILGRLKISQPWQIGVATGIVAFLVIQNAAFYFGAYRSGNYFQDANAELAMEAGKQLRGLGPHYSFYLMGQPRMFSGFPTIPFLAPANPRMDLVAAQANDADLTGHLPALIVATPDNMAALQQLALRYPGGTWQAIPRTTKLETLYYAYVIAEPATQSTP